ncbi:MAG: hypothetical protein AB8B54_04715, partial [Sphingorhabdus sp.]
HDSPVTAVMIDQGPRVQHGSTIWARQALNGGILVSTGQLTLFIACSPRLPSLTDFGHLFVEKWSHFTR